MVGDRESKGAFVRRIALFLILLVTAGAARAQNESKLHADFRGEHERFGKSCPGFQLKALAGCGVFLFTDHPLHIAAGSIAPQNGFGTGIAFVAHFTPNETWRLSWNTDAVGSINGSWRAGAYMKAIYTPVKNEDTSHGRPKNPQDSVPSGPDTVFHLYAQAISLNKLGFFGLGPATTVAARSFFGMRETILGTNALMPLSRLHMPKVSFVGEVNGRFFAIRGSHGQPSPSIEALYNSVTAPGLASQPGYLQLVEGLQIGPFSPSKYFQLDYLVKFQEFFAPGTTASSFRRLTADVSHQFPINGHPPSPSNGSQGPDDCTKKIDADPCPNIPKPHRAGFLEGSVGVRLFISESIIPAGQILPFYLQPTLGGSDINGNGMLGSFQDYRFRAPNVLVLRGSFEHVIYGPLGFAFNVDEGKVALTRGNIDFSHLAHSYAAGFTLRAGGFPQVFLLFAWGGHEGTHTTAQMNMSLLGAGGRPSLF